MYERPDVPKLSANRNVIAAAVIAVVFVSVALLVTHLWRLANEHSKLGSSKLSDAIAAATVSPDAIAQVAEAAGVTPTGDTVEVVAFLVTADDDEKTLTGLNLAAIDDTQEKAALVSVPVDARVGTATASLASVYASGGAKGVTSQLAAGVVPVSHIVVMTESGWGAFMEAAQSGAAALKRSATRLLDGIVLSDLDAQGLLDIGRRAASAGISADSVVGVPTAEASDAAGTYQQVDSAQLALAIGTMA